MLNKKLQSAPKSKLKTTLTAISSDVCLEKQGLLKRIHKSSLPKAKSFRLRDFEMKNLSNIKTHINNNCDRMEYSDSQVIRGIINYVSQHLDKDVTSILACVRNSS